MATENTSPRRSGADWFGLAAFAVLLISSTVLVIRLISTRFLSTGHLLLASGALLVLSGLHGWVQLPPEQNRRQDRLRRHRPAAVCRHDLRRGGPDLRAARHY